MFTTAFLPPGAIATHRHQLAAVPAHAGQRQARGRLSTSTARWPCGGSTCCSCSRSATATCVCWACSGLLTGPGPRSRPATLSWTSGSRTFAPTPARPTSRSRV